MKYQLKTAFVALSIFVTPVLSESPLPVECKKIFPIATKGANATNLNEWCRVSKLFEIISTDCLNSLYASGGSDAIEVAEHIKNELAHQRALRVKYKKDGHPCTP